MSRGNVFDDFRVGQTLIHACPRTVTTGDTALYQALYGSRFALNSADSFAKRCALPHAPVDDLITFHIVLGKSVPDISLNAVANLGYAEGRFGVPVYPGDTIEARSEVLGLRQTSRGDAGIVWVRTTGRNQRGETVLSYVRWVLVRKADTTVPAPESVVPETADAVAAEDLPGGPPLSRAGWDTALAGSDKLWGDYEVGERIAHIDGHTIEEAEHQMATRLWQNPARVHFDAHRQGQSGAPGRLVYGGHVISIARALSVNGLANACSLLAINGGTHANPVYAGDTVYAWSEVLDKAELSHRSGFGALRLRLVAFKNAAPESFPLKTAEGRHEPHVLLDFDCWVMMPV